jgi:hypothetical protein
MAFDMLHWQALLNKAATFGRLKRSPGNFLMNPGTVNISCSALLFEVMSIY